MIDIEDIIITGIIIFIIALIAIIYSDISIIKENVENITSIETECIKINKKIYCE